MKSKIIMVMVMLCGAVFGKLQAGFPVIAGPAAAARREPVNELKGDEPVQEEVIQQEKGASISFLEQGAFVTQEERQRVLKIINSLDSELYKAIITIDPTGERHVQRHDDFIASNASIEDGLPVIFIASGIFEKYSEEFLRAIIAHELGHYVSGHFFENNQPIHDRLFEDYSNEFSCLKKDKKVSDILSARETFYLAQTRITEHEADRSEILDFGIDIDTAIKAAQVLQEVDQEKELKDPGKHTFKTTHPLWSDRIKHFQSLRQEVEVRKARGQTLPKFNWQQLAKQYLQKLKESNFL